MAEGLQQVSAARDTKHNHFGEESGKAVPKPQTSRYWIPSVLTLIPTITYLCLIALQAFRG